MWFILSKAIHVAAKTSFLFFNSSTVEPHGAVPESDEYEKNTNYAVIKSTNYRQGSNFKHIYC